MREQMEVEVWGDVLPASTQPLNKRRKSVGDTSTYNRASTGIWMLLYYANNWSIATNRTPSSR